MALDTDDLKIIYQNNEWGFIYIMINIIKLIGSISS